MRVRRRDIWLADLREPVGSEAGYVRPVVIVQSDSINASRLSTYVAIPITGIPHSVTLPWNLPLPSSTPGLSKPSIAQINLIVTVAEAQLIEHLGEVSAAQLARLFICLDLALGRA